MNAKVEKAVRESATNYRKMLIANGGTGHEAADYDFKKGAEWVLGNDELLKLHGYDRVEPIKTTQP